MKRGKKILAFLLIITMLLPFVMNIPAEAAEKSKQLDVLFTHDTHSHLNSFSTIVDGEQKEVGGFAKLKTLIDERKKENPDTLILDGGDFSMGTLIQTVYDTEAAELKMLGRYVYVRSGSDQGRCDGEKCDSEAPGIYYGKTSGDWL